MKLSPTILTVFVGVAALSGCAASKPRATRSARPEAAAPTTVAPSTTVRDDRRPLAITPPSGVARSSPTEATRRWIQAVRGGDIDGAWALTAPQSRRAFGGHAAFAAAASELAEGWGAWARSPDATYVSSVVPGHPDLVVVTVRGTVSQEGPPAAQASAIPVRVSASSSLVTPFEGPPITFQTPSQALPTLTSASTVQVAVPAGSTAAIGLDTGRLHPAEVINIASHAIARLSLPQDIAPGSHSLTVALTTPDGRFSAAAIQFAIASPGARTVSLTPEQGPVGTRVHIDGNGFQASPGKMVVAGQIPLWLSTARRGCDFFASTENTVHIGDDGHLSGDFVVPSIGDCRQSGPDKVPVTPGSYQIVLQCTPCSIALFDVTPGR